MDCGICRRSQKDGFRKFKCEGIDYVDECRTKEVPKLSRENEPLCDFLLRYIGVLFDGFGGFNVQGLQALFDIYGIPEGQRPVVLDGAVRIVGVIRELRAKNGAA